LRKRQRPLQTFLTILGVPAEVAEEDACKIEHILHSSTLDALSKFVDFIQSEQGNSSLENFKNYKQPKKS
jgi:DtxR family Mn-dependent transcriptional regulator